MNNSQKYFGRFAKILQPYDEGKKEGRKDATRRYEEFILEENMVQKLKENSISVSNCRNNYIEYYYKKVRH